MTSYFDDFTVMTNSELARGTKLAVETLFDVIGVCLSKSETKNQEFSKVFGVLGVSFDLHLSPKGFFSIGNTDSRMEDLNFRIEAILKATSSLKRLRTPRV